MTAYLTVVWSAYRKCEVCKADTGEACHSLTGYSMFAGRMEYHRDAIIAPHRSRKLRTGGAA